MDFNQVFRGYDTMDGANCQTVRPDKMNCTVHIDSKKRVTLRGALYQYYDVKEYQNGCIMLEPRELTVPDTISARTLADMDKAINNFKKSNVTDEVDLSDF